MSSSGDAELRARITALADPELARMLTLDAHGYRDDALEIAREEAARRELDLSVPAKKSIQRSRWDPGPRTTSLQFTQPFPAHELARFRWAVLVSLLAIAIEIFARNLPGPSVEMRGGVLLGTLIVGMLVYLRIVYRLHCALRTATQGRYPTTPAFAVVSHLIPFYNFYWLYRWPARVAECAAVNGKTRWFDHWLPGLLFLAGWGPGWYLVSARVILFFAAAWYAQYALLRALRHSRSATGVEPRASEP